MTTSLVIGLLATPASGADSSMPAALTTAPEYSVPGGAVTSSGVSGAQRLVQPRVAGAVYSQSPTQGAGEHGSQGQYYSGSPSSRIATWTARAGEVRTERESFPALSGAVSERGSGLHVLDVSSTRGPDPSTMPRSETCSAHKAVRWYSRRLNDWRGKMGAGSRVPTLSGKHPCPRYLAHLLKRKSYAARLAFGRWHAYQYDWQAWLPDKWQRIGACETGYGHRPGNWRHSNSSYEGAFGFAVGSWDAFTPYADRKAGPYPRNAYLATPRQQYEVALAIQRRYGLSGWGCRNS